MNNSDNSVTAKTPMAVSVTLQLRGYLTPSLNRLLGQHWSLLQKEKVRAKLALLSSLREAHARSSTPTISQEAVSHLLTSCATPNSSLTTTRKRSKSSSGKSKLKPKPKK
jgi:hypothetical protein